MRDDARCMKHRRALQMRLPLDSGSTQDCKHHANDVLAWPAGTSMTTILATLPTCSQHSSARVDSLAASLRALLRRRSGSRTLRRIAGAVDVIACSSMIASSGRRIRTERLDSDGDACRAAKITRDRNTLAVPPIIDAYRKNDSDATERGRSKNRNRNAANG